MDWIRPWVGLGRDFQETCLIGLGWVGWMKPCFGVFLSLRRETSKFKDATTV